MKDDLKKAYHQEMPPGLRDKLLRGAEPLLERNAAAAAKPGFLAWLVRPIPALGLAAGAAAVAVTLFTWQARTGQAPDPQELAWDPAMVRDAELLLDLEVLQNLDKLEERRASRKWRKTKS